MTPPYPPPSEEEKREVSAVERNSVPIMNFVIHLSHKLPGIVEGIFIILRLVAGDLHDHFLAGKCIDRLSLTSSAIIGSIVVLTGLLIRVWCYRTLGRLFTFQLALLSKHKLITTGPYAIVRHPSYTGAMLVFAGTTLVYGTRGSSVYECSMAYKVWAPTWALMVVASYALLLERCIREDNLLRSAFGEEWEIWSRRVRWKLVPWLY
ncbi:hypothetical protein ID866_2334 [Astraeus odoratus]|nr:hypothetical protein ID866_2334 [Astraeus odoratus]